MRGFRHLAVVAAIVGLTGSAAVAASAATSHRGAQAAAGVHLRGGATAVTTAPGIAPALLKNGIVPLATAPGTESVVLPKSGPAVRFAFPVTGGSASLSPLGGKIYHAGGIFFANVTNGKTVLVLGTDNNTTITATNVIVGPPHPNSTTASQVVAFNGTGDTSKTVGQIPASYRQGTGTILTGTTANQATEAALLAYPGGVVDRVVKLGNGDYEVHNIGVNWPHHIFVNQDLKVIGAND